MYDKKIIKEKVENLPFNDFHTTRYQMTFKVNATKTYDYAKEEDLSFFNISLAILLEGINSVPEMKRRIINNKIIEYEKLDAVTPILKEDKTITEIRVKPISEYKNLKKWNKYVNNLKENLEENRYDIEPLKRDDEPVANFSCIPWMHFDSLTNMIATPHQIQPLITWGRYSEGKIPISITVNHMFVFGYHLKLFNDTIVKYFENPNLFEKI